MIMITGHWILDYEKLETGELGILHSDWRFYHIFFKPLALNTMIDCMYPARQLGFFLTLLQTYLGYALIRVLFML